MRYLLEHQQRLVCFILTMEALLVLEMGALLRGTGWRPVLNPVRRCQSVSQLLWL